MTINWQKILAVVLGLVVLAGISYLVLWLKPPNKSGEFQSGNQNGTSTVASDISGWKTYRDEAYGFEVRYPTNYFIHEIDSQELMLESWIVIDENNPESLKSPAAEFWPYGAFVIKVGDLHNLEALLAQEKASYSSVCSEYNDQLGGSQCPYFYKQVNTLVGGVEAIMTNPIDLNELDGLVFNQDLSFEERYIYYLKGDGYFYEVEKSYLSSGGTEIDDKIFLTFKFIES